MRGAHTVAVALNNWGSQNLDRALLVPDSPSPPDSLVDAGRRFQAALRVAPRYAPAYDNLGTIYAQWGDVAASAEAFARAVAADPNDRLAYFQLGLAQAALGDEAAARESWRWAGAGAYFIRRAKDALGAGDLAAGMLDALRAVEIDPADVRAYEVLADVYVKQGNIDAALQVYRAAPDPAESLYKAGALLRKQHRPAEAIQALQQALAQSPDHLSARLELGRVYSDEGDCEQARVWLAPLMTTSLWRAREPKSYVVVGRCLLQQDDPLAALTYLSEAVALDAKSVDARWLMGQAYEAAGYPDAAVEMYRQVLRIKPDHGPATKALESLGASLP
jgi:tetratricopeptide (TPR) repeat protein